MPRRFMHLRARTDRFSSLTGLLSTAASCLAHRLRGWEAALEAAAAFLERLAQPQPLGAEDLLDLRQRRLAEVLAARAAAAR